MSQLDVRAHRLTIEPHPDADRLDLARVGDYVCVTQKGKFKTGDMALYIPEGALVPLELLDEMGFTEEKDGQTIGTLAGKDGNRVKAIRLRGVLSQGLLYNPSYEIQEGEDYTERLGVTKYVPPVPMNMSGDVEHVEGLKSYTDIENLKKYPDVFSSDEVVWISEKIHGSCVIMTLLKGEFYVSSKGLASKELALKESESNIYWKAAREFDIESKLKTLYEWFGNDEITLFGEVLGVQDLMYGLQKGQLDLRLFDIRINGVYADFGDFEQELENIGLSELIVPILDMDLFNLERIKELAEGKSTLANHIREGVVIKPMREQIHPVLGRKVLKLPGDGYLTRKGKVTEYE